MRYFCVLIHHRLPAICCAFLCTGALILNIGSATTCQFVKLKYNNPHSPYDNFDNQPIVEGVGVGVGSISGYNSDPDGQFMLWDSTASAAAIARSHHRSSITTNSTSQNQGQGRTSYSSTHELGLFCQSSIYNNNDNNNNNKNDDPIIKLARGFEIASLVALFICTVASWLSTCRKPTYASWKALSTITIITAGVSTPVFLFFMSQPCTSASSSSSSSSSTYDNTNAADDVECTAGKGFFLLVWSIILLISVTVITQVFNYPEYIDVLDEWKVKKRRRQVQGQGEQQQQQQQYHHSHLDGEDHNNQEFFDVDLSREHLIKIRINEEDTSDRDDDANRRRRNKQQQQQRQQQQQKTKGGYEECNSFDEYRDLMMRAEGDDNNMHLNDLNNLDLGGLREGNGNGNYNNNDNDNNNHNDNHGQGEEQQRPLNLFSKSLLSIKSLFYRNNYNMKHAMFYEDDDYDDYEDYRYSPDEEMGMDQDVVHDSANGNANTNTNNNVLGTKAIKKSRKSQEIDMRCLDTRSDSSRLILKVTRDRKILGDDRQSVSSFDLNLDDYSIHDDLETNHDNLGDIHESKGQNDSNVNVNVNVETTATTTNLMSMATPTRHPSPRNQSAFSGEIHENGQDIIIFPVQFSPASRAATGKESGGEAAEGGGRFVSTLPTQQLQSEHDVDYTLEHGRDEIQIYPTQQLRARDGNNEKGGTRKQNSSSEKKRSSNVIEKGEAETTIVEDESLINQMLIPKPESLSRKEREELILNLSFHQAIAAGTSAAENSNNSQEDEPEPVYYSSSSESETSSISTWSSYNSENIDDEEYGSNKLASQSLSENYDQLGSYSDSDLPETSRYLKKKARRSARKLQKKKEQKKKERKRQSSTSSRCMRSVCSSNVSLMDMTIDEETDRDLELEERSGSDVQNSGLQAITVDTSLLPISNLNIVSPTEGNQFEESVKSSPAAFVRRQKLHNNIPVVSPTNHEVDDEEIGKGSTSKTAHEARQKREQHQSKRSRSRPQRTLSDIIRLDSSVDVSYGSDEASC